jgi:hypothetical protein
MRNSLGRDIGLVLTKGILLSLLSVLVLLPALTLLCLKGIDRTGHRTLLPGFRKAGGGLLRVAQSCWPSGQWPPASRGWPRLPTGSPTATSAILSQRLACRRGRAAHSDAFAPENRIVVLLPDPGPAAEAALASSLTSLPGVRSVDALSTLADPTLPRNLLPGI